MGSYRPDWKLHDDDKYDRYQILTIRELFEGKQLQYPPFRNVTFKEAPVTSIRKPKTRSKGLTGVPEPFSPDEPGI